jgi:hypothetical protein
MNEDIKRILQREKQILEEVLNMENDENENIFPYYIKILKSYEAKLIEADTILKNRFEKIFDHIEKKKNRRDVAPILVEPNTEYPEDIKPFPREKSLNFLRNFIKDSTELIIIDPYFYTIHESDSNKYSDEMIKTLGLKKKQFKKIIIIFNSKYGNSKTCKIRLKNELSKNKKGYFEVDTSLFHDRVIIKDRKEGLLTGASLNGIGKSKYSFINKLEDSDLKDLFETLYKHKFLDKK